MVGILMEIEEARRALAESRQEAEIRQRQYLNADPDMEAAAYERWQSKVRECRALRMHYEALLVRMNQESVTV